LNPIDWMMPMYKAFGARHPHVSLLVVFVVFGCFFSGWWWLTGREYTESLKVKIRPIPTTESKEATSGQYHQRAAIIDQIVSSYGQTHKGKFPTALYINKRLQEQGQNFQVVPPLPFGNIHIDHSRFVGNGIGVLNTNPKANFTFTGTEFINNRVGFYNDVQPQQDKDHKTKKP